MARMTRAELKRRGYEPDQIDDLIGLHTETTDALQARIDDLTAKLSEEKEKVSELNEVKEQLKAAKQSLTDTETKLTEAEQARDSAIAKATTATEDLDKLKTDYAAKETATKKENALRTGLKNGKYSDEAMSIIFDSRKNYADKIELDDEGKAKNLEDIMGEITAAYPQYTPKSSTVGAAPATPPANSGRDTGMTWAEIDKIKDPEQRHLAMAKNMKSLGLKK